MTSGFDHERDVAYSRMPEPHRIKVAGDLFHLRIPDGAVYVGRSSPGLAASSFANSFSLRKTIGRHDKLRRYLDAAVPSSA